MNADMFMFLFADVQVTFLQPVLLKPENHIYLLLHREKMGSHVLVETSRDPECPKVRRNDLFFRHVLF